MKHHNNTVDRDSGKNKKDRGRKKNCTERVNAHKKGVTGGATPQLQRKGTQESKIHAGFPRDQSEHMRYV